MKNSCKSETRWDLERYEESQKREFHLVLGPKIKIHDIAKLLTGLHKHSAITGVAYCQNLKRQIDRVLHHVPTESSENYFDD